jgi:hypothetical protein
MLKKIGKDMGVIDSGRGYDGAGIRTWHLQDLKFKGCLEPGEHY